MDGQDGYVLVTGRGVPMRLSPQAYLILGGLARGQTAEQIAGELTRTGEASTPAVVERRAEELLARIAEIEANPRQPPGFWLRRILLGPDVVDRLSGPLAHLFDRRAAVLAAVTAAAAGWVALARVSGSGGADVILGGYLLFLVSLAAHEVGHAAAAKRTGIRPSGIGFVMYLVYPAFFSDVTEAWRLPRRQRVLIDIGGLYFQSLFAVGLCLLAAIRPAPEIAVALALIGASVLTSLNPFIRFDGYWIFIDAVGVTSVSGARISLWSAVRSRLAGGPAAAQWSLPTAVAVGVYLAILPLAWTYMILVIGPFVIGQFLRYPGLLVSFLGAVSAGRLDPLQVQAVAIGTLLALGGLLFAYRIALALVGLVARTAARVTRRSGLA